MKNTTKLKYILQLYTVSLDMDDEGNLHLTLTNKRTGESEEFMDKSYSIVVGKGFSYMNKKMRESGKSELM